MMVYEYITKLNAVDLGRAVYDAAKYPVRLGGVTKEDGCIVVKNLATMTDARFEIGTPGMLRVLCSNETTEMVGAICSRLVAGLHISQKPYASKIPIKPHKDYIHAKDILAKHMATEMFQKYIIVLPEALAGAAVSAFRKDGSLDRYLSNLPKFAEAAFTPSNKNIRLAKLASDKSLTHFSERISETAEREYREDYVAVYNGETKVFPMHVTIGSGFNASECMSIHFCLDRNIQKLVIARFGPHGRGARLH
jgi:hypothetical protein